MKPVGRGEALELVSTLHATTVIRASPRLAAGSIDARRRLGVADNDTRRSAPSAAATPSGAAPEPETPVLEVPAPPVVIEGELPHLEPTPEDLIQHLRDSLKAPPSFLSSERRLADGTIEVTTRFGRFCSPPVPGQRISGVGGDVRLVAPLRVVLAVLALQNLFQRRAQIATAMALGRLVARSTYTCTKWPCAEALSSPLRKIPIS